MVVEYLKEVRWEIEDILTEKSVNYVVFAYFDVGVPDVDAATGNQIVNVALTIAEITRLGNGDPVSLGTISGVQGRGQGSDNSIAKNNAINAVAKNTAKKLVALINSKGINLNLMKKVLILLFMLLALNACY